MRSTFARLDQVEYRLKATAALLGVSENTLRTYIQQSGIEVRRQSDSIPGAPAIRLFDIPTVFAIAAWRREQGLVKSPFTEPIVIAIDIIKGGTGKSTTTAELSVQLQLAGFRVLVIDIDGQANLTQLLGYESDLTIDEADENDLLPEAIVEHNFSSICLPYVDKRKERLQVLPNVANVLKRPFGKNGPTVIPADTFLGDLEQGLAVARGDRDHVFKDLFKDSKAGKIPGFNISEFDFVLIDCPPSISFVSTNAIAAADVVVAPIRMDLFGVKGMSRLVAEIDGLSQRSPDVRPELIILPTHYSANLSRVARMHQQLQAYQSKLYPSAISASEMFPKSQEQYLPLTLQSPTSQPVKEYRMFMDFLVRKCASIANKSGQKVMAA